MRQSDTQITDMTFNSNIIAADDIIHLGDTDTLISLEDDKIVLQAGALEMVSIIEAATDEVVINDAQGDINFRVESDALDDLLFCDAGTDRVGIKTNSPNTSLEIITTSGSDGLVAGAAYAGNFTTDSFAAFAHSDNRASITTDYALLQSDTGDTFFNAQGARSIILRQANTNEFMRFGTSEVVVNESGLARNFRIEGDTEPNIIFVDGTNDRVGIFTNVPTATFHLIESFTDSAPHNATTIDQTWSPSSTSGNVFPTTLELTPTYDTTHTPAAASFLTSFRLFSEVADSGVISIRNIDLLSTNSGAGTVANIDDISIRTAINSGGGAVTQYRAIVIAETSIATTNIGIFQLGASMINTFFGDIRVGTNNTGGKVFIDQNNLTGARPPLFMRQRDVSEEFIRYRGSAAAATLTQSIVAEGDVTTATRQGFIKVFVQDDGNQITDQDYFHAIYTLA